MRESGIGWNADEQYGIGPSVADHAKDW